MALHLVKFFYKVIITILAGRNNSQIESLIGLFAKVLPIRITFTENINFINFLEKMKIICNDVFSNQDISLRFSFK